MQTTTRTDNKPENSQPAAATKEPASGPRPSRTHQPDCRRRIHEPGKRMNYAERQPVEFALELARRSLATQRDPPVNNHAPISDLERYNLRLRRSLIDKLYFADKTDARSVVDYGCADGTLIGALGVLLPGLETIGYDTSEHMIAKARSEHPGHRFTADWEEVVAWRAERTGASVLVLNSVIHEVYSYGNERSVAAFWERMFTTGFEHVAIRDMVPSETIHRQADPITVAKVRQRASREHLAQWERCWGTIDGQCSLVHFLLTAPYTDNWPRELAENYFPVSVETLLAIMPRHYEPIYIEHYTLAYVRERIAKEFGIEMNERTHLKLMLKRTA